MFGILRRLRLVSGPALAVGVAAVAFLLVVGFPASDGHALSGSRPVPGATPLSVPAPTGITPLDLGMYLNASVNVSAISGGSGNASNWHYAWLGLPGNCTSVDAANVSCVPSATGAFAVQVKVSDSVAGGNTTSAALNVTINADPVVTSFTVTPANGSVGTSVTFTTVASGGSPPLEYVYSGLPAGCSGNLSTVTCSPRLAQTYNATVQVFDAAGYLSNSRGVAITITAATSSGSHPSTVQWGEIAAILVVGLLVALLLLWQARREEHRSYAAAPRPPVPGNPPPAPGGEASTVSEGGPAGPPPTG